MLAESWLAGKEIYVHQYFQIFSELFEKSLAQAAATYLYCTEAHTWHTRHQYGLQNRAYNVHAQTLVVAQLTKGKVILKLNKKVSLMENQHDQCKSVTV
jgi:hypothetical protein